MKVKLFKCSRHIYASEYNDYDSVISYLVSQYSDWEEVTQEEYDKLFKWVHRTNDNLKSRNEFYLLVQEPDVKLALEKTAIKEQIAYEEERYKVWARQFIADHGLHRQGIEITDEQWDLIISIVDAAKRETAESAPCLVAREGELTYECNVNNPCRVCKWRTEILNKS